MVTIRNHGDFIASLPSILGYYPKEDAVITLFTANTDTESLDVYATVRMSIDHSTVLNIRSIQETLQDVYDTKGVTAASVVIISTDDDMVNAITDALLPTGACALPQEIISITAAHEILTGQPWRTTYKHPLNDIPDHGQISNIAQTETFKNIIDNGHDLPDLNRAEHYSKFYATPKNFTTEQLDTIHEHMRNYVTPKDGMANLDKIMRVLDDYTIYATHDYTVEKTQQALECIQQPLVRDSLIHYMLVSPESYIDLVMHMMQAAPMYSQLRARATTMYGLLLLATGDSVSAGNAIRHAYRMGTGDTLTNVVVVAMHDNSVDSEELIDIIRKNAEASLTELLKV